MILALYGAGAMGREFKYMADASGNWEEIVFIDDNARTEELMGCRVLKFRSFSSGYTPEKVRFVVTIGEPRFRMEAFERMKRAGYEGAVLCDPTAYVSPDAEVGEGTAVCRDAYVGSLCRVGRNVYISAKAAVGHDSVIGDHTRLGVMSFTGGHTVIGKDVFVGSGAMLRDRIQVGDGSVIALGAAVFEDVPAGVTMMGNPARMAGETGGRTVYAPSRAEKQPAGTGLPGWPEVAETFWNVFVTCFDGIDFNPVTFHLHDEGWDSLSHMKLTASLEEAFGIHFKGREIMRMNTFQAGLNLVRKKLEEKAEAKTEGKE